MAYLQGFCMGNNWQPGLSDISFVTLVMILLAIVIYLVIRLEKKEQVN